MDFILFIKVAFYAYYNRANRSLSIGQNFRSTFMSIFTH